MKTTQYHSRWSTIISVTLVTSLAALPAFADSDAAAHEARISADVQAKSATGQLSPEERQALSLAAGRVLMHVGEARQEITKQDTGKAVEQVNKGLTLVQIIEKALPEYQVTATIKAGDLVYQDEDKVKTTIVPIYTDLEQISLIGPIESAKKEVVAKNSRILGSRVVEDVELQHTAVWFDVALARRELTAAMTALKNNKLDQSDKDLTAIETAGVSLEYAAADLPLVQARENLTLAKKLLGENRPQEAHSALREASNALQVYEKEAKEGRAQKVQSLRQEVDKLAQTIEADQTGAKDKITRWWDQLAQWVG